MLKHFRTLRCLILSILMLILLASVSAAAVFTPHAEKLVAAGGKIYGLYSSVDATYTNYLASEIVEFDADLNKIRSVKLEDADGNVGKNAERMSYYNGKLYVACQGGFQGVGTFGDVWEVDIAAMTARQVLNTTDISVLSGKPDAMPYGINFASDGTAFLLCRIAEADWTTSAMLFVTNATDLSAGNAGTAVDCGSNGGYFWDVLYDDNASVLWCRAGNDLQIRSKTGALLETFTPIQLGNNIGTISILADTGAGKPGIFYTATAGDYSSGSFGVVTKTGADAFSVTHRSSNYGSDLMAYAFEDHNSDERVLMREWSYSGSDTLYVWGTSDWNTPITNVNGRSTNIHDVIANGPYLYLAAFERNGNAAGEFIRLDMQNGYARDKQYQLESVDDGGGIVPPPGNNESGGGGCDMGGASVLVLFVAAVLSCRTRRCSAKK